MTGARFGWRKIVAVVALVGVTLTAQPASPAASQAFSPRALTTGWGSREIPYDGKFTFVRLRWRTGRLGTRRVRAPGPNFWLHEFPRAEQNLMETMSQVTAIDTRTDGSLILTLDDPQLFRYPIAVMWEPGFWTMTDQEAERLREYLLKGGFVIFHDFEQEQWENFEAQMRRVIPDAHWYRMDPQHNVFKALFQMELDDFQHPPGHHLYGFTPEYFGLFEDNNPRGRLLAIANYNTNLAEFWQVAGSGFFPIDSDNDAFKLGINYIIYGMTH
jgi:hypothetical protein